MSTAYYIVLDKGVEFSTFTNGKAVASAHAKLTAFCKKQGIKAIDDFYSQDASELFDDYDGLDSLAQGVDWYAAQEGVEWLDKLILCLKTESVDINTDVVVKDLEEYRNVLERAAEVDAKWHFEIDI